MLRALLQLAIAVGGFAAVLGAWFLVQALARRRSGCGAERDLLDYLLHGCGGCDNASCRNPEAPGHPAEEKGDTHVCR